MKAPLKKADWQANPGRDWRLILSLGSLLLLSFLAGGWWLAQGMKDAAYANPAGTATSTAVNPAALEKAVRLIDSRAENFAKFQLENPNVVDPSQP